MQLDETFSANVTYYHYPFFDKTEFHPFRLDCFEPGFAVEVIDFSIFFKRKRVFKPKEMIRTHSFFSESISELV